MCHTWQHSKTLTLLRQMRTTILISLCFLIVISFSLMPYHTTNGAETYYYYGGLLPNILTFVIICAIFLAISVTLLIVRLRQKLPGQLAITQINKNLFSSLQGIIYWVIFVTVSQILSKNYFSYFKNISSYFFIILGTILFFYLFNKWYVLKIKPEVIAIDNDSLYFKSFLKTNKRNLKFLKSVDYNSRQNTIDLKFHEGLDNIHLNITEYAATDLQKLISKIESATNDNLIIDQKLINVFHQG